MGKDEVAGSRLRVWTHEAGTVGALAAVTNAALDALWDHGVQQVDMPLTPQRVWSWLESARTAAE